MLPQPSPSSSLVSLKNLRSIIPVPDREKKKGVEADISCGGGILVNSPASLFCLISLSPPLPPVHSLPLVWPQHH